MAIRFFDLAPDDPGRGQVAPSCSLIGPFFGQTLASISTFVIKVLHVYSCEGTNTNTPLNLKAFGSIFGKRDLLAIYHIMLALFWSYVPNMKELVDM